MLKDILGIAMKHTMFEVLKIAIIVEKHSSSLEWYVDTSLQLLEVAGDFVTEDVGHRIIQVVTNNESLQLYAVNKCYKVSLSDIVYLFPFLDDLSFCKNV